MSSNVRETYSPLWVTESISFLRIIIACYDLKIALPKFTRKKKEMQCAHVID